MPYAAIMFNLFIFRRDFRLYDNTAWKQCVQDSTQEGFPILPAFIFHDRQINPEKNLYYGSNCVQFMIESLEELAKEVAKVSKLAFFHTHMDDTEVLAKLMPGLKTIYCNRDVTPYAKARDKRIEEWAAAQGVEVKAFEDYTLHSVDAVRTGTGGIYTVYTPFYKSCLKNHQVSEPQAAAASRKPSLLPKRLYTGALTKTQLKAFYTPNPHLRVHGGRRLALAILDRIRGGEFREYEKRRDKMADDGGTTKLSAYIKFGCVSVREVFAAVKAAYGIGHGLIRELYWREFYAQLVYHNPELLHGQTKNRNLALRKDMDQVAWKYTADHIRAWREGRTGFPLVDAGIRELLTTGYMHNRLRMVVSMFLTKDMLIDWREGEQFFARHLVDYDPAQNNGGWQWSSSTGADSQPYFRIFNPWRQAERFDPAAEYVHMWVPELRTVPPKALLKWYDPKVRAQHTHVDYPAPILDHSEASAATLKAFKALR